MAEALAQNVITSFVQGVISSNLTNLNNLASKEAGLLLGVRREITYIIEELEMMKAFLRSAEEKQETDFMARVWVRRVREVSLALTIISFLDWLGFRLRSLCTLHVRHEIAAEIQDLKYRIAHISDCRLRYGITAIPSSYYNASSSMGPRFVDYRLGALFIQEDQLVGIDEPRRKLTNLLIRDEKQCRVISVLGMGGLGKTTLTKRVYEDLQMIGEYFDCRAWITISQTFNLNVLLRDIIKQVASLDHKMDLKKIQKNYIDKIESKEEFDNMQSNEDLINQLEKLLKNKRYIVVLDDIWSIDAWESIKHALPENNNRSRVIVTTRIEEVANNCCADASGVDYVYKLQLLSKEQSMELFQRRVFGHNKRYPEHLENVANDLIAKCGGLPLAIVAMAGVLKSMPTPDDHQQWTNLLNNLSSVFETNQSLEGMKQVLLLSYNHLPYLLKPCFLYLSIFPEDHLIIRKNLIQLWVAEGLVCNQYAMSAEVVAEYYFNELVSRSLILPSEVGLNGKVKSYRIHDIMLEVLIFKSMEENMVSIHGKHSRSSLKDGNVIRRLSLQRESNQIRGIPDDVNVSQVTSLLIYDFQMILALLPRFRLLRVLVFENYSFDCDEEKVSFLQILSKFRHLRYLSLKGTSLKSYPTKKMKSTFSKSLSKLRNLVTLDIRDVGIRRLAIPLPTGGQLWESTTSKRIDKRNARKGHESLVARRPSKGAVDRSVIIVQEGQNLLHNRKKSTHWCNRMDPVQERSVARENKPIRITNSTPITAS
ncbi:Disease resistance protein RPP13 [Dendrobium catenatum]|uniref:Disease resistance protein RPP13 n=1 Tax=Dendrobium catenatum TaxID=906689 RepID=A0A2I0WTF1_9ASPA|nr:Disease resistance protein RPP13 [Dendrobium catenatum]